MAILMHISFKLQQDSLLNHLSARHMYMKGILIHFIYQKSKNSFSFLIIDRWFRSKISDVAKKIRFPIKQFPKLINKIGYFKPKNIIPFTLTSLSQTSKRFFCSDPRKPAYFLIQKNWNLENQLLQVITYSNRHNKMEHSIGEISLSSRLGLHSGLKGKTNTSTNQTSKAFQYDSTLAADEEDSIQRPDKAKEIQKRIISVEQSQAELQAKFEKVIESLGKEIAKKDETNAQLELQISTLRSELEESRKDLGIIVGYLAKRKAKALESESRRVLLNTTKMSGGLDKSLSGSKGTIDISGKSPQQERKNKSPRLLMLKKSFKA